MTSHYELSELPRRLKAHFKLAILPPTFARADIRPTDFALIIREQMAYRLAAPAIWGLMVPGRDGGPGELIPWVAADTMADRPGLRATLKRRRCLVPATALWENGTVAGDPPGEMMRLARHDDAPLAFAGLWESWRLPGSAETVDRFGIIATASGGKTGPQPAVLDAGDWDIWLDPQVNHLLLLRSLLHPCPEEWMSAEALCC